jgi:hypothetical protein
MDHGLLIGTNALLIGPNAVGRLYRSGRGYDDATAA